MLCSAMKLMIRWFSILFNVSRLMGNMSRFVSKIIKIIIVFMNGVGYWNTVKPITEHGLFYISKCQNRCVQNSFGLRIFLPAWPVGHHNLSEPRLIRFSHLTLGGTKAGSCWGWGWVWQFDILYLASNNSSVDHCKLHRAGLSAKSQLGIVFLLDDHINIW